MRLKQLLVYIIFQRNSSSKNIELPHSHAVTLFSLGPYMKAFWRGSLLQFLKKFEKNVFNSVDGILPHSGSFFHVFL